MIKHLLFFFTTALLLLSGITNGQPLNEQSIVVMPNSANTSDPQLEQSRLAFKNYVEKNKPPEHRISFWSFGKYFFSGLAVAGIAGRFGFQYLGDQKYDDYLAAADYNEATALSSEIPAYRDAANISLVIGAVSAGLAALSFLLEDDTPAQDDEKEELLPPGREDAPSKPPLLASEVRFDDENGDGFISPGEVCELRLVISNKGLGEALDVTPYITSPNKQIEIDVPPPDDIIYPGQEAEFLFTLRASDDLGTGTADFGILVREKYGFDLNPQVEVSIKTRPAGTPLLSLEVAPLKGLPGDGKLSPADIAECTFHILNNGDGPARDVSVRLFPGKHTFLAYDDVEEKFLLDEIAPQSHETISFSFYTNQRAEAAEITLVVNEKKHAITITETVSFELNTRLPQPERITIAGKETAKKNTPLTISPVNELMEGVPVSSGKNRKAVAVVIGNRDYDDADVPDVEVALNDARVMKEYLITALGYEESNILYYENASQANFTALFGSDKSYKGELHDLLWPGESDVFIYYSGHGSPDVENGSAYFLPVDSDPNRIHLNGYPLKTFYKNLSKLDYRSITIVLDACFSGQTAYGALLKNASPVYPVIERPEAMMENLVSMTSVSGNQISSWYKAKGHSLFSYFLFSGLKGAADADNDRSITLGELEEYVSGRVKRIARVEYGREQQPAFRGVKYQTIASYK